jgi:hypothetical protein
MLVTFSHIQEKNIEDALKNKVIGGEITILDFDINETDYVAYFGNVSCKTKKISEEKIVLTVDGDEKSGGKILKINLGKNVCVEREFKLKFDGKILSSASDFDDILNPDDDGLNPEFYILSSSYPEEGTFLLVTIPHFSEHQLIIEFVVDTIMTKAVAIFIGIIIIMLASFYMFKK